MSSAGRRESLFRAASWLCRIGWHRWAFVPEIGDRCVRCWDRP